MKTLSFRNDTANAKNESHKSDGGIKTFLRSAALADGYNISVKGGLTVWASPWRTIKYYYGKKGRKWNTAERITSGILGYYGLYGNKAGKVDADGCVTLSDGGAVSDRKLTEVELAKIDVELVGQIIERGELKRIAMILEPSHNLDDRNGVHTKECGEPNLHIPTAHNLENSEGGHRESHNHHSDASNDHAGIEHDPLAYIAHMGLGHGHNPFWWLHLYGPHHGDNHRTRDVEHRQTHEGHESGHETGENIAHGKQDEKHEPHGEHHRDLYHANASYHAIEHDPLAYIAHMGLGHSHNPFWWLHLYGPHHGNDHKAHDVSHKQRSHQTGHEEALHLLAHLSVGHTDRMPELHELHLVPSHMDVQHFVHLEDRNETGDVAAVATDVPIGLIFDLRDRQTSARQVVASALPPLE